MVAVVDKAESEVVVLVGVPLFRTSTVSDANHPGVLSLWARRGTHGISEGVSRFDGGGGRLISIGWEVCDVCGVAGAVDGCCDIAPGF